MTILAGDIRILQAEARNDTDEGGGRATNIEVVDGLSNNIFTDISELARAYGNVSLQKVFPSVFTNNTDTLFGTHILFSKLPTDEKVKVCMFTTKNHSDYRKDARERLERYLARGPKWAGHLLEAQLEGQRAIQQVVRENDVIPVVGQGLVLTQDEGLVSEFEQYVRVQKIDTIVRNFTVGDKEITRKVCTIELTDPLRYTFEGPSVAEFESNQKPKAVLRDTRVADAATYYGASKIAVAGAIGDGQVQVQSIYTNLVPSAQSETAMVNLTAAGENPVLVPGNNGKVSTTLTITISPVANTYLGVAIYPTTLEININGTACWDFGGEIKTANAVIGTIEYDKGLIRWNENAPSGTRAVIFNFTPAAAPIKVAQTDSFPITQENRGYVYTKTLFPTPAPASLVVSYVANKKVYYLRDTGNGRLSGSDVAFGTGTINYGTGAVVITLGAQPDTGSELMFSFGTKTSYFTRSDLPVKPLAVVIPVNAEGLTSGTIQVTWTLNGVQKTATDTSGGAIQGDATGRVDYVNGIITLYPNKLPHKNTQFTVNYGKGVIKSVTSTTITPDTSDTNALKFTIAGTGNLLANTIRLEIPVTYDTSLSPTLPGTTTLPDDKATATAVFTDKPTSATMGNLIEESSGAIQGTINYQTRQVVIRPSIKYQFKTYTYDNRTSFFSERAESLGVHGQA